MSLPSPAPGQLFLQPWLRRSRPCGAKFDLLSGTGLFAAQTSSTVAGPSPATAVTQSGGIEQYFGG
jgi:hypothetical protein